VPPVRALRTRGWKGVPASKVVDRVQAAYYGFVRADG
jgi:hypothetical protein